jgi:hypothetical protein
MGQRLALTEGDEVPLLFLATDPSTFALCNPDLGMFLGVAALGANAPKPSWWERSLGPQNKSWAERRDRRGVG